MVAIGKYSLEDAEQLIKLARQSINSKFNGLEFNLPSGAQFNQKRGVFVTLTKNNKLRGCIGFSLPKFPIAQAVADAAKSAAFADPRFPAVQEKELSDILIEISILTLPQKCDSKDIIVGRDGLIANYAGYKGLLLPQVAIENNMNKIEFLECVCQKAGLPDDAWQKQGFHLQSFQAQIFKEKSAGGEVVEIGRKNV